MNVQSKTRAHDQDPASETGLAVGRNRGGIGDHDAHVDDPVGVAVIQPWQTATTRELLEMFEQLKNRPRCVEADADGGEPLRKDSTRV